MAWALEEIQKRVGAYQRREELAWRSTAAR
jgi:hypothetical protein